MSTNFAKRAFGVVVVGAMLALPARAGAAVIVFDQIGAQVGTVQNINDTQFIGVGINFDVIKFGAVSVYCDNTGAADSGADECYLNFDTDTGEFTVTADNGLYDAAGVLIPGVGAGPIDVLTATSIGGVLLGPLEHSLNITGTDTKLAALLEYFGLANPSWTFINSEIKIDGSFATNTTTTVENADITNASPDVPEPGLMALFGLGLVGLGRQVARRKKR